MDLNRALPALLALLVATPAVVANAAPAKPPRKIPGLHKVGDITLKRGIVKMEALPVRAAAAPKGKGDPPPTETMSLNFAFPPRAMAGDDVAFLCSGEFPAEVEVVVTHELRGKRGRPLEQSFRPEDGRFAFIVGTSRLDRGTVTITIALQDDTKFGSCSMTRETVEKR